MLVLLSVRNAMRISPAMYAGNVQAMAVVTAEVCGVVTVAMMTGGLVVGVAVMVAARLALAERALLPGMMSTAVAASVAVALKAAVGNWVRKDVALSVAAAASRVEG